MTPFEQALKEMYRKAAEFAALVARKQRGEK